jgi:type VI secretion system protein ImpJ
MSATNRVIWNEGLFIKPQHFQQQQRYTEYLLDERINAVSLYLYGVNNLRISPEHLSYGSIAIESATGVMPDGTVFKIPQEDILPDTLKVEDSSFANQEIYLALPLRSDSILEISWPDASGSTRFQQKQHEVRDIQTIDGDLVAIDVSPVKLRLMFEKEDRSAYASIAIAKIAEKRPDGSVLLDPSYIPCHTNVSLEPILYGFIREMAGLMKERAKNIASRMGDSNQGSVADVSDFMLLQALNRMHPQLQHLSQLRSLHPERLYEALTSMCGELASFTDESRTAPEFLAYQHDKPGLAFKPVMSMIRNSLSIVLEPRAVSLRLEKRKHGLMIAPIKDPELIDKATFIIAVQARMPMDQLRKLFVQQTKIASVEKIRDLISLQLPGVPLSQLAVAPRQLPYHAGYTYYQLDKSSTAWSMLINSSGFAFHVAGDFPELELQFWAIRD